MRALSRRNFVGMGLAAATTFIARGALALPARNERILGFHSLHTGEKFVGPYWEKGNYLADALAQIRHVLRDHRNDEEHEVDPNLLDLLTELRGHLQTAQPFQVICGYRSPQTNDEMREEGHRGVAAHSYHMAGQAIDIRVEGRSLKSVRNAALTMAAGGVGYYRRSNFVHVDVGPVRHW